MQRITWAMFLLVLLPGFGLAQTGRESWDNLSQLHAGQKIEVVDMKLKSLKGTFVGSAEGTISLRIKKSEVAVPRADVLRVSLRENSKRGRNILIGAAIGAGAGLAMGAAADSRATEEHENLGKGFGPLIGGGLGAALGAGFPGYQTIYRAEKQRSRPQP